MGMHHGVIAAKVSSARLIEALNAHTSTLEIGTLAPRLDDLPLEATDDGFGLAFGERGGATFIFDPSLILSADLDLMAALSRDLDTTVLGWGAETVSGTYWFIACRDGQLVRGYWNCHMDMRAPWSRGAPLPTEMKQPFNGDVDGDGLAAAARVLGFDFDDWLKNGPFVSLSYDAKQFPPKGPLRVRRAEAKVAARAFRAIGSAAGENQRGSRSYATIAPRRSTVPAGRGTPSLRTRSSGGSPRASVPKTANVVGPGTRSSFAERDSTSGASP